MCAAGLLALAVMTLPLPSGEMPHAEAAGDVATAAGAFDAAVVRLMILDRRMADAETLIHEGESEIERLETEAAAAGENAAQAAADLAAVRSRFSDRLAESYKTGDLGWLEILLTSDSLSVFLDRTDLVNRILAQDADLTQQVAEARTRALEAGARLAQAAARRHSQVRELQTRRDSLQTARTEQTAVVARLGNRLEEARAAARAAARRMTDVNHGAGSAAKDPVGANKTTGGAGSTATTAGVTNATRPASSTGGNPPPGGRTLTVKAYAYALRGTTASGIPVAPGVIAVDPRVIPLGTRLWVPGYGEGIAADTGGDIKGNTIDVWMPSERQASDWGIKTLTITVYY